MQNRIPAYQNGMPPSNTAIQVNQGYIGETIEQRVAKILNNKEPITDGAPQIYTDRSDGVLPEHNIRTDRFEQALDMTNQIYENKISDRKKRAEARAAQNKPAPDTTITTQQTSTQPTTTQHQQNQ